MNQSDICGDEEKRFIRSGVVSLDGEAIDPRIGSVVRNGQCLDASLVLEVQEKGVESDFADAQGDQIGSQRGFVDEVEIVAILGDQRDRRGPDENVADRQRGDQADGLGVVDIDARLRFDEDQQIVGRRVSEKVRRVLTGNVGDVRGNLNGLVFAKGEQRLKLERSLSVIDLRHSSLTFAHICR